MGNLNNDERIDERKIHMEDDVKLVKLDELANLIKINRDSEGNIPESMKYFTDGALTAIDECNESWCDTCPLRKEIGMLCSDWLELK